VRALAGDVVLKLNRLKADIKSSVDHLETIQRRLHTLAVIERERYYQDLLREEKYMDKTRLEQYGFKVYSQYEEDGIIQETFHRIGLGSKTFIEFGVETGLENNTLKLLLEGWSGLWLEGNPDYITMIRSKFSNVIASGNLRVQEAFVDRDNINELICQYYKGEIDLMSIDIDGNDIYILENLEVVSPRVVVIEYNGKFPPPMSVAQKYNAGHRWRGTDYGGASLTAITKVANRKGYSLVGCTLAGVNAFLVRNDLVTDRFCKPFTPENHYQPARYFLWQTFVSGHPPDWGDYVTL
jgi:hypothetical protein